jgi:thioredoxin 1
MAAVEVTDATFADEVLGADEPVLVDFWAPWCKPCRAIEPGLLELAAGAGGRLKLVKLDVDANLDVPSQYGVLSLPTVMLFHGGEVQATIVGPRPPRVYAEAVAPFL